MLMPASGKIIHHSSRVANKGSLPAKFIGSCMRLIQNRIAKVLSLEISFLVQIATSAKASAVASAMSAAG